MKRLLVLLIAALAAAPATTASAAGGPVGAIQGGAGAGVPGRPDRYVAIQVRSATIVQRMWHGNVWNWTRVPGHLGVPAAAYDGSTTGLSADGGTLVLTPTAPSTPRRHTTFLILNARRLKVRERVHLDGWFALDALSPDGNRLYLLHYRHGDILRYEVRAYDLAARRLLPKPIVDPREPDEKMLGAPMTRTMSPDGRWAYTLYDRPEDAPFIHALDTRRGTAACIDLDDLRGTDTSTMKLVAPKGGGPLRVVTSTGTQALVDRRTFEVSRPVPRERPAAPPAGVAKPGGGITAWIAGIGALAAVAALAGIAAARRRRYDRSASFRNAS